VSDAGGVSIPGVTGLDYLDKPAGFARRTQTAPLKIDGEIDRVYLQPPPSVALIDPARPGAVHIDAWGHRDLVVWNPGPAVAQSMADFDDAGYRNMVCVEPALALDHRRRIAPGEQVTMGQAIRWDAQNNRSALPGS
jgi:glucose-6-phosphate 1-epimerase